MPNQWFRFKQFTILQEKSAMKVGTDGVLLGAWTNAGNARNILDIGSGTGIIALMMAQRFSSDIVAIEIDKDSFDEACLNIEQSRWKDRIRLIHEPVQDFATNCKTKFDCIVSNPPYFVNSMKSNIKSRNTARHTGSLSFYELFRNVSKLLSSDGRFSLILPFDKKDSIIEIANNEKLFITKELIVKGNHIQKPKRILMEFSFIKQGFKSEILVIENNKRHDYTKEYIELTKDFYLKF